MNQKYPSAQKEVTLHFIDETGTGRFLWKWTEKESSAFILCDVCVCFGMGWAGIFLLSCRAHIRRRTSYRNTACWDCYDFDCLIINEAVHIYDSIALMIGWLADDEQQGIWREAVVTRSARKCCCSGSIRKSNFKNIVNCYERDSLCIMFFISYLISFITGIRNYKISLKCD